MSSQPGGGTNLSLYILKGVCALFVVCIHVRGIGMETMLLLPLMRIAVPCFYMISGYYMFKGIEWSDMRIESQMKKIARLLLTTTLIYIAFFIFLNILKGQAPINNSWKTIDFWVRWAIYGDNLCYPLWYLTAYLQVLFLLLIVSRLGMQKVIMWLIPLLLSCSVVLNRYSFIITNEPYDVTMSRNAWFCALPCVLSGIWIRQKGDMLLKCNIMPALVIVIVLAYIEYFLLGYLGVDGSGADYNLTTYPLAALVVAWCIQHPKMTRVPEHLLSRAVSLGKLHSTNIYLYHIMILTVVELMEIYWPKAQYLHNAESIAVMSLIFSIIITKFKEFKDLKICKE